LAHMGLPRLAIGVAASATSVPEPGTLLLLTVGLIGLAAFAWRKRKPAE
jgi:hypothetical protein